MKGEFLTSDEIIYLEQHLSELILLLKNAYDELQDEIFNSDKFDDYEKEILKENAFFKDYKYAFTNGCCFYFARLMKTVLPDYIFVMRTTNDFNYFNMYTHVLLRKGCKYFDVNYEDDNINIYRFDHYIYTDADNKSLEFARTHFSILDDEIYEKLKYKFYRNIKDYLKSKKIIKINVKH